MLKKNKIYSYDNGFNEVCIVLTLEKEESNFASEFPSLEDYGIIDVLIKGEVRTVMIDCLYEIKGIDYGNL